MKPTQLPDCLPRNVMLVRRKGGKRAQLYLHLYEARSKTLSIYLETGKMSIRKDVRDQPGWGLWTAGHNIEVCQAACKKWWFSIMKMSWPKETKTVKLGPDQQSHANLPWWELFFMIKITNHRLRNSFSQWSKLACLQQRSSRSVLRLLVGVQLRTCTWSFFSPFSHLFGRDSAGRSDLRVYHQDPEQTLSARNVAGVLASRIEFQILDTR